MKVILGIFAVITLLYVIHFSISYVSNRKKESFSNDDDEEHFSESSDKSYSLGMDILKIVDAQDEKMSLGKKLKSEVVKDLFGRMDELKGMSKSNLEKEVEKVAKEVKSKGNAEKFEEDAKQQQKEEPKQEETKPDETIKPTPVVATEKQDVTQDLQNKLTMIRTHLKSATDVLNTIVPERKKILNVPEIPMPKPDVAVVKEKFTVNGFENVASYADWD